MATRTGAKYSVALWISRPNSVGAAAEKSGLTSEAIDQYFEDKKIKRETEKKAKEFLADADLSVKRF